MRKWLPVVLIAANFTFAAWVVRRLPAFVTPSLDLWIPWTMPSGEPLSRAVAAFALPIAALGVWLLLTALASPVGERLGRRVLPAWLVSERTGANAVDRFEPTFELIIAAIVASIFLIHIGAVATMLGWPTWIVRAAIAGIGLVIVAVGNVMPRTRPNWIAGLRTKDAMSDPDLWRATHRRFGALLMVTGVAVAVVAVVATPYAMLTAGVGALVSAIVASVTAGKGGASGDEGRSSTRAVVMVLMLVLPMPSSAQPMVAAPRPPADVSEHAFEVTSSGLVLPGTLAMPAVVSGRIPVAVIVAGSGPTDRNGNGPLTQTDLYAQLAWALARGGIASVRYDKRGIGEGGRTIDHTALTIDDYVKDVAAVARSAAADSRFSNVFLVGHSEGAGHVLQAANRGVATAGVAMLAGTGRPLGEVLHDQLALQVDAPTLQRIDSAFVRFIRGEDVPDVPEAARPVLVPVYRRMIASMAAYDPAAEIARVRVPVLIVQGETDLQVTLRDSERLRAAQPAAKSVVLRSANHVFKTTASRDAATQQPLYHDRTLPMVPELGIELVSWIKGITN